MSRRAGIIIVATVIYWIPATILTAGIQHAHALGSWNHIRKEMRECRGDLGFSWAWGAMPATLPMIFFMSGFAYDGWSLSCEGAK